MLRKAIWNLLTARGAKPVGVAVGIVIVAGVAFGLAGLTARQLLREG